MAVVIRPVAGLRAAPRNQSELLTQEVWGRQLEVLSARPGWKRCRAADGMSGWVPDSALAHRASYEPTHVVARRFGALKRGRRVELMLPLGSLVQVCGVSGGTARVLLPGGARGLMGASGLVRLGRVAGAPRAARRRAGPPALAGDLEKARRLASRLIPEVLGTPYLWGGSSTFGFDCSGLVQVLYRFLGRELPRDSRDQAEAGRRLKGLARLRPLDLLFFATGGRVDHVAVHLGGLSMLHSSGHVRVESLRPCSPLYREDLRRRFAWATRPMA